MESNTYLRLALPTPVWRLFDYLPPLAADLSKLKPGLRVKVPFQTRELVGVLLQITKVSEVPSHKLKQALAILDQEPLLPNELFELCQFAAHYYHYPIGEVLQSALPAKLTPYKDNDHAPTVLDKTKSPLILNQEQAAARQAILAAMDQFQVLLLEGVTGSGKTEVYLQAMAHVLQRKQQVLVLVPEISLTPQTIMRFRERFQEPIWALHSDLNQKARNAAWWAAKRGEASIVIGTRSALFTPFAHLGLIVIDEEHDTSLKQQDRFRYHARDLAIRRAQRLKIPVVLGSATPSLESLWNADQKKYKHLILHERAGTAQLPTFKIVDLRTQTTKHPITPPLLTAIQTQLQLGQQVMLFLNRRGYAPVLYCTQCGWLADCKRCDAKLVYHAKQQQLRCHHCDAQKNVPVHCPQCSEKNLVPLGAGTQKLESFLQTALPNIPILRFDRDNVRKKGQMEQLLAAVQQPGPAILLGTQMLAKGHHFPRVTLVGIVDGDAGFFSADFRAVEQMGQLIIQVAGRAGRGEQTGTVWIQTHQPDNPLLQLLVQKGYADFAKALLVQRKTSALPPFLFFALIRAESYQALKAQTLLETIKVRTNDKITLLGPVPALMPKRKGLFCYQLLLKATSRKNLQIFLQHCVQQLQQQPEAKGVKWSVDVDPLEW